LVKKRGDCVNAEQIIYEIEWLEQLFGLPDIRTPQTCGLPAENQNLDEPNFTAAWRRLPRPEWLEDLFRLVDPRPLQIATWKAARLHPPAADPATP
jgi:hypothetical protein